MNHKKVRIPLICRIGSHLDDIVHGQHRMKEKEEEKRMTKKIAYIVCLSALNEEISVWHTGSEGMYNKDDHRINEGNRRG